jgi:hypothetical protein
VFEPGEGRGTRQVLRGVERDSLDAELKHGVIPETVGIIAVRIAGSNLIPKFRPKFQGFYSDKMPIT